eukprot:3147856-Rhodomonas_salina.2
MTEYRATRALRWEVALQRRRSACTRTEEARRTRRWNWLHEVVLRELIEAARASVTEDECWCKQCQREED